MATDTFLECLVLGEVDLCPPDMCTQLGEGGSTNPDTCYRTCSECIPCSACTTS